MSQTKASRSIEAYMAANWTATPLFWADVPYDPNVDASVAAHSYKTPDHTAAELRDSDGTAGTGFLVAAVFEVARPSGMVLSGQADLGAGSVEAIREFRAYRLEFRILSPPDQDDSHADALMIALEALWLHRELRITGDANYRLWNWPLSAGGDLFRQRWDRFEEEDWTRNQLDVFLWSQAMKERPTTATTVTIT